MTGPGTLLVALSVAVRMLAEPPPPPPPPPPPTPEEAFELGFNAGQAQYEAGAYLQAARTWVEAAGRLAEVAANRENRAALFDYIADAYLRGLPAKARGPVLREAIAVLDAYCDGFLRTYGAETPISPKVLQVQAELRRQLGGQPTPGNAIEPSWAPTPAVRPWKGLMIGGGVLVGMGVGAGILASVAGARGNSTEAEFESARCSLYTPTESCADLIERGRAANAWAVTGAVVAPLALGGGVAMVLVGVRRRAIVRHALLPVVTPTFAGLTFQWDGPFRKRATHRPASSRWARARGSGIWNRSRPTWADSTAR